MGRASTIKNSFNAGEFSALMLGRQDIAKYPAGLFVCLNGIPLVQGPWTRRPGTAYLHQTKHHNRASRLLPFQYSVEQTYVLEFGHQYIRFFTEHGILTKTAQNITGITKTNPAVLTYSGSDTYADGERVIVTGVVGMTQVNNREFVVTNVNAGANTFQLYDSDGNAVDSTNYGTYSSGGAVAEILEVTTAFDETDLPDIRVTQSADTLYITHPDFPPQELVRQTATSWSLADVTFEDGPYDAVNATSTTLSPSAATGNVTVTASAVTGINGDAGFQATDVGRLIRMKEGSAWGWGEIIGRASTTVVTVAVQSTLTNTNAKTNWRLGIYSDTTGYPSTSAFYDDRLFFAGAALYPQRLDGSKTGLYTNFAPSSVTDGTVAADNAVSFTLNADDVNAIKWMVPNEKGLLVGTGRGEWPVKPSSLNEALTPTNISAKPATRHGSADIAAVAAGKSILFVQRAARKVRELAYVFEADGFKAPDLTLLSEHITRPAIVETAYQEQPQAVLWAVRSDGVLLGMTYERDQSVVAWHRHELGGQSDAAGVYIPVVESICAVPTPDTTRDELYMVVQRYVNGGVKRYIEYMSKIWETEDEQEDAFYVDCGWTEISGSPTSTVTGLWHLEGETIGAYVDGARHNDVTVTNGTVTLDRTGSIITLGYFFQSDGQDLPIDGGAQDGSAQGKTKRIHRVGFWLVDTLGLKYGPDADNLTEILNRQWGDNYGAATELFTGVVRERFESDWDKLGQVYWRADGPFPANVLAIMPQFSVSDDS